MNHLRQSRTLLSPIRWTLAALLCVAWSMVSVAQDKATKAVVPSVSRQVEVRKLLDETFAISKATSATKKQQVAQKLMEMAGNPATMGDELYVVLATALPLLRDAGDFPAYLKTIEQLTESFQVDAEVERTKFVIDFMATCKSSTTLEPALNEVVAMVGRAAQKNEYRAANELLDVADRHAKRVAATKLSKSLIEVRGSLREREKSFIAQTQARQTLADKPDDPKANLAVGLWLAVYESDWEQALPKLALGSDAKWKAAAVAEPKSPAEVEGQLAAADAWWEVAQSATGDAKLAAQRRAHEWYKLHEPHVKSPLVKARVTKRLEELTKAMTSTNAPVGMITGQRFTTQVANTATIRASVDWQPTNIQVTAGRVYWIQAKGNWRASTGTQTGPNGVLTKPYEEGLHETLHTKGREKYVGLHPINSLICRFGTEPWNFFVGEECRFMAPRTDKLVFAMNDIKEKSEGSDGTIKVSVSEVENHKWVDDAGRVRVTGLIDSFDDLFVTSKGLHWKHDAGASRVGQHVGIYPTIVNGVFWWPDWPNWEKDRLSSVLESSEFAPTLKRTIGDVKYVATAAQGNASIIRTTPDEVVIRLTKGNGIGPFPVSVSWRYSRP